MFDQKYVVRSCMLYDFKQGKTAAESHRILKEVFPDDAPSESQCRRWFERFRSGDMSLEDEERGRPPEVIDNDELKQAIEVDPKQSTRELAEQFGCSQKTIDNHLRALGKVNRCGKWTPHELNEKTKTQRINFSGMNLRHAKDSGFWESIVTGDEKWISYDNITRKRQWLDPGEQPKPTPKPEIHGKKALLCVWWNTKGLVHFEVLDYGQTVTADLYSNQLDRVDQALKRQGLDTSKTKLIHDNARPHIAKLTEKKIDELGWELLPHPPYSPDLAPSNYHMFRSMQHSLAGKKI